MKRTYVYDASKGAMVELQQDRTLTRHGGPVFGAKDPTDADCMMPRALRKMEETKSARDIAKRAGFSVNKLKQVWCSCVVLLLSLAIASGADISAGYVFLPADTVTHTKLNNLVGAATIGTTFFTDKSALSSPVATDVYLVYSTALGGYRKVTEQTFLLSNTAIITSQTEKAVPVGGDYLLIYDTSAAAFKKAPLSNLTYGTNFFNVIEATNIPSLNDFAILQSSTGPTNSKATLANVFRKFPYTAAFTNILGSTALSDPLILSNNDTFLIYSAQRGSNRTATLAALIDDTTVIDVTNISGGDGIAITSDALTTIGNIRMRDLGNYLHNNYMPTNFATIQYTLANGSIANTNHTLGGAPQVVRWVLVCQTGDAAGYAAGDQVDLGATEHLIAGNSTNTFAWGANATNIFIACSDTNGLRIVNKTNTSAAVLGSLVTGNWKLQGYAVRFP